MAAYRYPTIKPVVAPELTPRFGNGSADQGTLQALFPGSPGAPGGEFGADDGEAKLRQLGLEYLLKGVEEGNLQTGRVDKEYGTSVGTPELLQPPSYNNVPTTRIGDPASAWVPNPISPGIGNSSPSGQPAPENYGTTPTNSINPVSAKERDPMSSSKRMADGQEKEVLESGKSPATT